MTIVGKLLDRLSGRISKDAIQILRAIDETDLVKEFGKDAMEALTDYEVVIPETRITIRRRDPHH